MKSKYFVIFGFRHFILLHSVITSPNGLYSAYTNLFTKIPGHHNTEIQERTSHVADGWRNGSLRVGKLWIHVIMTHTQPYSYYCEWTSQLHYSSAQSCKNFIMNDIFFEKCLNEFRCWICCCVPLCIDSCKDVQHFCSSCQAFLGTYKRI